MISNHEIQPVIFIFRMSTTKSFAQCEHLNHVLCDMEFEKLLQCKQNGHVLLRLLQYYIVFKDCHCPYL